MSEFIKGAYNKWEHNQTEQTPEQMNMRLEQLAEINQEWQCNERRAQIQQEMSIIAFELSERFRESKGIEVEEAWSQYERA